MAKSISLSTVVEKNKVSSDVPFLVALDIVVMSNGVPATNLRIVNNDEQVTIEGNTYEPYPFSITVKEEAGTIPSVSVNISDPTGYIISLMDAYDGGVESTVRLIVVTSEDTDRPSLIEYFIVTSSNVSDYNISFTLGAENALAMPLPRRRQHQDRCSFKYKSTECGYTGGIATCDLTLDGTNGCAAHNNVGRFGGFPGINVRVVVR